MKKYTYLIDTTKIIRSVTVSRRFYNAMCRYHGCELRPAHRGKHRRQHGWERILERAELDAFAVLVDRAAKARRDHVH